MSELNRIEIYHNNLENYIDEKIFEPYNYEIIIPCWEKVLVVVLNILTGGLGTILLPFLNKKKDRVIMIFAGILLGFFQTLHFLHFFSLLKNIKFLDDIYEYISGDIFLELFLGDNDIDNNDDDSIKDYNDYVKSNLKSSINDDLNDEDNRDILGLIINSLNLNISEIISQKERKTFLKILFGIISGMSYANSFFTTLVNFMADDNKKPNKKISYKIMLYSFLNPGAGIILSSFALFPYCRCCENKYNVRGIILSILGIIFGIIIMFSPVCLCVGTYLIKITDKMMTLFPIKITLILVGALGILLSFITSKFNQNTILEITSNKINPFDIIYKSGSNLIKIN